MAFDGPVSTLTLQHGSMNAIDDVLLDELAAIRLAGGVEQELDVIVLATGFDAVDGNYTKIDMRGRGGVTMSEKWKEGPQGYLGMMEADFPNLFMILGPNGPFTNLPPSIETQVEWISHTVAKLEREGRRPSSQLRPRSTNGKPRLADRSPT